MTEETGEWVECVVDSDYEIYSEFPYPIHRKGKDRVISECIDKKSGYVKCKLNRKSYLKHRIIANQFIDNSNDLSEVDHINHNRADNRIENLHWVSHSENNKNRTGRGKYAYTYLDELPDTAESLSAYNGHEFDGLYIDYENQKLYLFNRTRYREAIATRNRDNLYYNIRDIENKLQHLNHVVLFP